MMHCRAAWPQKHQGLVEEALHFEAVKAAVEPQIAAFAVAQIDQAGHELDPPARQLDLIHAGVVLHLGARFIGHPSTASLGRVADAQLPEPARER